MKKAYHFKSALLMLLVVAVLLVFAACANTAGTRVAGSEREIIHGYIVDINEQARTVTVDQVELYTAADENILRNIGVGNSALRNGYYAYNEGYDRRMLALANNVGFDFNGGTGTTQGLNSDLGGTVQNNGVLDNNVTNNNVTNNGVLDNNVTNNGVTNNGVANNGVTNNGVTNNNVAGNNVNNNDVVNNNTVNDNLVGNTVRDTTDNINNAQSSRLSSGVQGATTVNDNYGTENNTTDNLLGTHVSRIRENITAEPERLYTLTLENGVVVKIEDSNYLFGE